MTECDIFYYFACNVTPSSYIRKHMGYLEQAVRSRWAVPMTAFLIQLSQYWNTLVTVTWWSKRATVSVVWFCVLWLATILLLEIFLNRRFPFPVRCLLGTLVIAGVILTAMLVISLQSENRGSHWDTTKSGI